MDRSIETKRRRAKSLGGLAEATEEYVSREGLAPPLTLDELALHAELLLSRRGDLDFSPDTVAVFINNALWASTVAAVPFERRILLLPQCLRKTDDCQADTDEFGLLCAKCGACPMGGFHEEAERLGYVVLVAEGTTVVRRLIEGGKIDAVIGVSCEEALRKAFPRMASGAVPGLAVPLDGAGCLNTLVDEEIVRRYIHFGEPDRHSEWVDFDLVKERVGEWFAPDALRRTFRAEGGVAEIAVEWMALSGKRLRPALTVAVAESLSGKGDALERGLEPLAVAVECFHKASLAHDDIEDGDSERYGKPTLHSEWGVPVALDTGDFLVGEGYRLIAASGYSAETRVAMIEVASECHRALCAGQGEELLALEKGRLPLSVADTLDIFRGKTSPAFYAAIALGALAAGADREMLRKLRSFADALGVAYQIRDDLGDWSVPRSETEESDASPELSILASIVCEFGDSSECRAVSKWYAGEASAFRPAMEAMRSSWAVERAEGLLTHHRNEASRTLSSLEHPALESLLRKFVAGLFNG